MKKFVMLLLATTLLGGTFTAFAQSGKEQRDECLLASKNCANQVDTLQKRIKKLQTEIRKGKRVYSAEELKKLEEKLKEANEILEDLEDGAR